MNYFREFNLYRYSIQSVNVLCKDFFKGVRRYKKNRDTQSCIRLKKLRLLPIIIIMILSFDNGTGGLGNKRTSGDHNKYSMIKIGQNTKKSPGDLKKIAVTQTPLRSN